MQAIIQMRKEKSKIFWFDGQEYEDQTEARLARIEAEGGPELRARIEQVMATYPVLGQRPIKAAEYVLDGRVWTGPTIEWLIGQRPQPDVVAVIDYSGQPEKLRTVQQNEAGVFLCTCEDFEHRLTATPVQEGPDQQMCCHILAFIFLRWDEYGQILLKGGGA